ncbi:putative membrane protein [Rhizobium sp. SLBN-94]|nr:putative membrane protein [Rhizobium sp. SLBN-94]
MDVLERAEFEVKTFGNPSKESGLKLIAEVTRLRQLLSEAEKRERETLTQLSEIAKKEAEGLMDKWISDQGATVDTKAAGVASHIVNDFRGHIEAALIKLERRAALERSEGSPVHKRPVENGESGDK